MMAFWEFYVSGFWVWAGITVGVYTICQTIAVCWNRWLRSRNIAAQGWPTAQNMDADGDIVHPKGADQ